MKKIGRTIWGLCFLLFLPAFANGQEYPSRPVEFIVGYPPGGVSDTQARFLGKLVEKILGQPVLVTNKAGVSGGVAQDFLVNQKPDGYTIGHLSAGAVIYVPFFEKMEYTPQDCSYIMGFGYQLHAVSVRAEAPWNTFREFLDHAKKNPGKVRYATYSPVSTTSIVMDMVAREEGIDWTHIPYKGDGPAITSILGGHVDALATSSGQMPYVRSGKLRLLAVFNSFGSKSFPNVPTLKALGYKFPWLSDMTTSTGIIGPRGIKPEVLQKLEEAFTKATKDPSFLNLMESLDCPVVYRTRKDFEEEILNSYQTCEKILPPIAARMKK
jgi:tripartite-type tricarboxylate transporter receptor subunit TctC